MLERTYEEGETTFAISEDEKLVTITNHNQPICVIPLDDILDFGSSFAEDKLEEQEMSQAASTNANGGH